MLVRARRLAFTVALAASTACARRTPPPAPPTASNPLDFAPLSREALAQVANPHDHQGKPLCQRCHERGSERTSTDPIALCADCHDTLAMKHPWRIDLPGPVDGLPLMPGNVIACHTCHDPHAVTARRAGLRMEYGALCLRCHDRHGKR